MGSPNVDSVINVWQRRGSKAAQVGSGREFIISRHHPDLAVIFDTHLRRAQNVSRGMQRHIHAVHAARLSIPRGLDDRIAPNRHRSTRSPSAAVKYVPQPGRAWSEWECVMTARATGIPGVDEEIPGGTIEAVGRRLKKVWHGLWSWLMLLGEPRRNAVHSREDPLLHVVAERTGMSVRRHAVHRLVSALGNHRPGWNVRHDVVRIARDDHRPGKLPPRAQRIFHDVLAALIIPCSISRNVSIAKALSVALAARGDIALFESSEDQPDSRNRTGGSRAFIATS